ncbi:MAG: histidine phosphatase family protein [Planctomycetia bacterium]|nr:histidine phosphatase family protein [Planctomycetia bacterium]
MADSLVVIRAGSTDFDLQGRIRGTLDLPLCAAGLAEAKAAAAALAGTPPAAIYSASDTCSADTARHVARACGLRARCLDELVNLDQGLWQGMLVDDIRLKQPRLYRQWQDNPWAVSPPEGELLEQACDRVEGVLERMLRRHTSGRIALVVPTPLDQIVRWLTAGEAIGDLWGRGPAETSVVAIPLASQWKRPAVPEKARA